MEINERQKNILNSLITEYVRAAQPVSSQALEEKYDFGVCSATIRNEMQRLTDSGFIFQPHTSAGRVPTDKGYRFFVNNLMENRGNSETDSELEDFLKKETKDSFRLLQFMTKSLASMSSNLALSYLSDERMFWKEGFEEIFREPEFREGEMISGFFDFLKGFEEEIDELSDGCDMRVYIGRENPFSKSKDFSILISSCQIPKKKKAVLAIIGPKRMMYEKNINSLNSLRNLLEKL